MERCIGRTWDGVESCERTGIGHTSRAGWLAGKRGMALAVLLLFLLLGSWGLLALFGDFGFLAF